jgi:hypothetical protein
MGRVPTKSEWYYRPEVFLNSCFKFGFTPVILGQEPGSFNGLLSKAKLLKKAILNGPITADHIIVTDSFDVIFAEDPHKIIETFDLWHDNAPFHPEIVWNAERACFSDASLASEHPATQSSFKYLNSGWGCGLTESFLAAMAEEDPDLLPDDHRKPDGSMHHSCDQDYWMRRMLYGRTPIGLDNEGVLCQTYCGMSEAEIAFEPEGKIRILETGNYPMVHHANGNSKDHILPMIIKHLGY